MSIFNIATVLITDENRESVLLLCRRKPPYNNYWAFPGGKIEFGETITEAARREIEEETGLSLSKLKLLSLVNEHYLDGSGVPSHFVLFYFHAIAKEGEDILSSTEGELKWCKLNDLPERIVPSDREILRNWSSGLTSPGYVECELQFQSDSSTIKLTKWDQRN